MFCSSCGRSVADGIAFCPVCGSRLQAGPASPSPVAATPMAAYPAQVVWDYATWGNRVIGYIIDGVLVGGGMLLLWLVVALLFGVAGGLFGAAGGTAAGQAMGSLCCMMIPLFAAATLLVGLYNSVYLVSKRGFSIGQGVVKVKVVDANGNLLSQVTAFLRLVVRAGFGIIPFLPLLDLLWPLWDERRQTLHDKAVGCYVINNPMGM
jgi:uncharacterized RDD family membrane protein YckC